MALTSPVTVTTGGTAQTGWAANEVLIGTGANTVVRSAIPSCSNTVTSKLLYNNATQAFTCGTDQTAAGGGYTTVQDETVALTQRNVVNFTGAGVSCADNGGTSVTDCTIGGTPPGGSTTRVQYNNAGAFGGTTRVTTDGDDFAFEPAASTPAASATGAKVYAFSQPIPILRQRSITSSTWAMPPAITSDWQVGCHWAGGLGGSTLGTLGVAWVTTGTATAVGASTGTETMTRTVDYVSASTAGSNSRVGLSSVGVRTDTYAGGLLGFIRAGTGTNVTNQRSFFGFANTTTFASANPSTFLSTAYIGNDSGQTTLRACSNDGSGTATCTDLGASFPVNATAVYDMWIWLGSANNGYYVRHIHTGATASGTFTDLPAGTTTMSMMLWVHNETTASAVKLRLGKVCAWTPF
jgi:hypothetical protein